MGALKLSEVIRSGSALASFQELVEAAWSQAACRGGHAAALAWNEVVAAARWQMQPILLKADASWADQEPGRTGFLRTGEWRDLDLDLELVVGLERRVGSSA